METSIFPLGVSAFLMMVNEAMRAKVARTHARHVLQLSQDMGESVLYGQAEVAPRVAAMLAASPAAAEQTVEFQCERHSQVG